MRAARDQHVLKAALAPPRRWRLNNCPRHPHISIFDNNFVAISRPLQGSSAYEFGVPESAYVHIRVRIAFLYVSIY